MILDWLAQSPTLLVAVLVAFFPGIAALWGVGLRGLALWAAAPIFSVAATAISAVALGVFGVPWSPLSWLASMLGVIVLAWIIGRVLGTSLPKTTSTGYHGLLVAGLVVGILLSAWRLIAYIQDPTGISQTNDAVFHMNAVRYAMETSDASSLHVNAVIGGRGFYPAAWHGVVSLITLLSAAPISVAANALTLVIGAAIWPLGLTWLTREVSGSSSVGAYAAILSGALQTFPLLMFQWGVLFPNALSTALIPGSIALVIAAARWGRGGNTLRCAIRAVLLVLVAASAIVLSQPAAFLPWAAISAVWVTDLLIRTRSRRSPAATVGIAVALWAVLAGIWFVLARATSGSHWSPFTYWYGALWDVLTNSQVLIPEAFGVSILMIIGLVVAIRSQRLRWFAVSWLGISILYVAVASVANLYVRENLLGAWYADPYRIAALAPIVVIPLAALAADALVHLGARQRIAQERVFGWLVGAALTLFVLVLALFRSVAMPAVTQGTYDRDSRYLLTDVSFLSIDERALLEDLPDVVEPDARVLGNPSTGTGFGYFLSGIDVYPRTWSHPENDSWETLGRHLHDAADDPAVCDALASYGNPEYVLDFGIGELAPGRYELPGMTGFERKDGFELVLREGDASLWRITACAQ